MHREPKTPGVFSYYVLWTFSQIYLSRTISRDPFSLRSTSGYIPGIVRPASATHHTNCLFHTNYHIFHHHRPILRVVSKFIYHLPVQRPGFSSPPPPPLHSFYMHDTAITYTNGSHACSSYNKRITSANTPSLPPSLPDSSVVSVGGNPRTGHGDNALSIRPSELCAYT